MRANRIVAALAACVTALSPALPSLAQTLPANVVVARSTGAQAGSLANAVAPLPYLSTQRFQAPIDLSAGNFQAQRNAFQIRRTIPVASIRANPVVTVGSTRVNFRPMLENPQGLMNLGRKIERLPQLIELRSEMLDVVEVPQGVIVYNQLTYALKLGACSDNPRRAAVANAGARCFSRTTETAQDAAFGNANDPRYIADTGARTRAVTQAQARRAEVRTDINDGVARFRSDAAGGSGRAALVAAIGQAQVQRLEALSDEALAGEIANTAETKVEEAYFIPAEPAAVPTGTAGAPAALQSQVPSTYDIGRHIYLAGFTLGREYVWSQKVTTKVNWCLIGCPKTYYVEAEVRFAYGFGLRIPIELGGSYTYDPSTNTARLDPTIRTFNGNIDQYRSTKLDDNKLFRGQELVAEIGAGAWAKAGLPIYGTLEGGFEIGVNLTDLLANTTLAGGNFTPPAPNAGGPSAEIIFDSIDLLGANGSFGIVGVKVHPGLRVNLTSSLLTLDLRDPYNGGSVVAMTSGGHYPLRVNPDRSSRFSVENPKYGLNFELTPGIDARAFVDLAVWSAQWDFPVWFPQLSISVQNVTFACHDGTTCSRTFTYTPQGGSAMDNTRDGLDVALEDWSRQFDNEWRPKCADMLCRTIIEAHRRGYAEDARNRYDAWLAEMTALANANAAGGPPRAPPPKVTFASLSSLMAQAAAAGRTEVNASLVRSIVSHTDPMVPPLINDWKARCKDEPCTRGMDNAAADFRSRIREFAQEDPQRTPQMVFSRVQLEFHSRFQTMIAASERRVEILRQLGEQNYRIPPPQPTRPPTPPTVTPRNPALKPLPTSPAPQVH